MIQHVALETHPADVEEAIAFWRIVGFARVEPPLSLADRTTWVQRGSTQIHLLWTDHPSAPQQGHAAVVVDRYEETLAALREAGFAPEPRQEHWGAARSFVRAPGGHRVELMSASPV